MAHKILVGKAEMTAKTSKNLAEVAALDLQNKVDAVGGTVKTITAVLDTYGLSLVASVEVADSAKEEAPKPEPTPVKEAPPKTEGRKVEVQLKKGGRR